MPPTSDDPGGAGEFGVAAADGRRRLRVRAGHRQAADELPHQPRPRRSASTRSRPCRRSRSRPPTVSARSTECRRTRSSSTASRSASTAPTTSACCGCCATCSASPAQVRLRARGLQGVHVPHQRQGVQPVLRAGLRHQSHGRDHDDRGPAGDRRQGPAPDAGGLARRRRRPVRLLPAGPDHGRGGAGEGGQGRGPPVSDADLDEIRNVCRCGTYPRIRKAIEAAAAQM